MIFFFFFSIQLNIRGWVWSVRAWCHEQGEPVGAARGARGQSTLRVSAEVPGGAPWVPRAEHTAQPGAPCPAGLGQQDWHLA